MSRIFIGRDEKLEFLGAKKSKSERARMHELCCRKMSGFSCHKQNVYLGDHMIYDRGWGQLLKKIACQAWEVEFLSAHWSIIHSLIHSIIYTSTILGSEDVAAK